MRRGFTIIELMIAITIVGLMVSLGVSAYGRARERQVGLAAGEQIIGILNENQKIASIGNKDCTGKFIGQQVVLAGSTLTSTSLCEGNQGVPKATLISEISFSGNYSLVFNPLNLGINLGTTNPLTISYTNPGGSTYALTVNRSGTIQYLGLQ